MWRKKEQDSDMNLSQFQVDFKWPNSVSWPISLSDEVNIDPSDEFSQRKLCHASDFVVFNGGCCSFRQPLAVHSFNS